MCVSSCSMHIIFNNQDLEATERSMLNNCIKEMWCVYTYWNASQQLFEKRWNPTIYNNIEGPRIMLSEMSQIQKDTQHASSLIYGT